MDISSSNEKIKVYANYGEEWPVFCLHDSSQIWAGDIELTMTKEAWDDYQENLRRYQAWQTFIKQNAFPKLEDA